MSTTTFDNRDQNTFQTLMNQTYKKVFNLAFRLSGNRSDAEELTQEAYFRAYRGFQEYEGDRPFENWIFRIVTRLFLDLTRSRKRRVQAYSYDAPVVADGADEAMSFQTPDSAPNPEEALMQVTLSEPMQRALDSLKEDQRMLVILADVEGMPYDEIAKLANVPVGTVRSRLHRAHKKMKAVLSAPVPEKAIVNPLFPKMVTEL